MLARHVSSCHDTFSLSLTNVPHNHNMFHVLTGSWALPQLAILLQHPQELLASHVQQHHYGWQPETCSLLFCLLRLHCIAVLYGESFKAGYFSWLIVITHLYLGFITYSIIWRSSSIIKAYLAIVGPCVYRERPHPLMEEYEEVQNNYDYSPFHLLTATFEHRTESMLN